LFNLGGKVRESYRKAGKAAVARRKTGKRQVEADVKIGENSGLASRGKPRNTGSNRQGDSASAVVRSLKAIS